MKLVNFKTLDQFSQSSIKISVFSLFNQILLDFFDISSAFHNSIKLNIKAKMCQTVQYKQFKYNLEIRMKRQINLTKFY